MKLRILKLRALKIQKWFLKIFFKIWHLITYRFRGDKIHICQAVLSGHGSFVDIRYRLSRPDRAQGRFPVYLVDEATGSRFELMRLPRYGRIRTKHNKYQASGILLFRNRSNIIRTGSRVTLVFGPLRVQHIEVK